METTVPLMDKASLTRSLAMHVRSPLFRAWLQLQHRAVRGATKAIAIKARCTNSGDVCAASARYLGPQCIAKGALLHLIKGTVTSSVVRLIPAHVSLASSVCEATSGNLQSEVNLIQLCCQFLVFSLQNLFSCIFLFTIRLQLLNFSVV